jgi:surfeit locus 1 family protein
VRAGTWLALVLVLLGTGVCVRLGLWQLSRLQQKRAANAALRAAMDAPPVDIEAASVLEPLDQRRVRLRGRFDERVHVLLSGRARQHSPGVHVVTPFVIDARGQDVAGEARAVLVDRGWLSSPDAVRARPQDYPEPGEREVIGVARALAPGQPGLPWRRLPTEPDSITLWSARTLDVDSVAIHVHYAVPPYVVAELPGPGVPAQPARAAPTPLDESMHLSYAIQWFLFGSILLFGSAFVAWSRRHARPTFAPAAPEFPAS